MLFSEPHYATHVWLSRKADKALNKLRRHQNEINLLFDKVEFWATTGFIKYEGGPIKHERDGVSRLGRPGSLLRMIGFYANDNKAKFLIIDAFLKLKHGLGAHEKERIREVARVKRNGAWKEG
jgi:hypothetical protein